MNAFNIYKFIDFKEEEIIRLFYIFTTRFKKKGLHEKFDINSIKINIDREFKKLLRDDICIFIQIHF